jgi:hypothetical protein
VHCGGAVKNVSSLFHHFRVFLIIIVLKYSEDLTYQHSIVLYMENAFRYFAENRI